MRVRDLMTPNPVTVHSHTPVDAIAQLLVAHRINGVPVVDEQQHLLGVVTAEDLIYRGADERFEPRESLWKENFWISFLSPEGAQPGKAEGRTAAEVMTHKVHSVGPDDDLSVAARLMVDWRITSLPVVESGVVIGVVSRIDLLRRLHEFENPLKREN
ncbi:CBS domain-containing protein [Acidithiobacillus sp. IBUN Pt1247-S3]|uniref:CBS domain-containing protein n=1 Tax=Acidithiobacillus sp. IBUN Pt1247-S3 TaxID=3166642 RepID=UPI0034E38B75